MTVDEEMIRRLQATLLAKIRGGDPCGPFYAAVVDGQGSGRRGVREQCRAVAMQPQLRRDECTCACGEGARQLEARGMRSHALHDGGAVHDVCRGHPLERHRTQSVFQ